jgi:hypothetical protein
MFSFFRSEYAEFSAFLQKLSKQNQSSWPSQDTWPRYKDLPGYTITQYEQSNGKAFLIVKFDEVIMVPDGFGGFRHGKNFKVGGDKFYPPVCQRFCCF